jgi:NitT/TauT family transport system permease protein
MTDATVSAATLPDRAATAKRLGPYVDAVGVFVALITVWQIAHLVAGSVAIASPAQAYARLTELLADPDFPAHAWETGFAFLQALAVSLIGGLVIGVAIGGSRLATEVAEPMLVALYSLPKITFYPVILLLFGLGMEAKVAFGAIHGIIPVALFTMNGVRNVPVVHLRTAKALRMTRGQIAARILVPSTIPEIVSGFRIGFSLTMLGTLIGELFASQRGIGFLLLKAMERNDTPTILALAALLFAVAIVASMGLLALDRHLHRR